MTESGLQMMDPLKLNIASSTFGNEVSSYSSFLVIITYDICTGGLQHKMQVEKIERSKQKLLDKRIIVHAGFILVTTVILLLVFTYYFGDMHSVAGGKSYISIVYFF